MAFVSLALARPAVAEGPSAVDKDAARSLVQQGDERMAAEDLEGALEAYRRADDIMGVPTTSIEVGRVAMLLGRLVQAKAAFERAAAYPKRKGEPKPFTTARREAEDLAFGLTERIPTLTVRVEGLPADQTAEVTLDGELVDIDDLLRLDPDEHQLRASASGFVTAEEIFELAEYDDRTITLHLTEAPATVWPMMWIGYGIGGASLIVGSITGVMSLHAAAETKEQCAGNQCPPSVEDSLNRSRTLADVSTAMFIVTGAAVAVGTTGLILSLGGAADGDDADGDDADSDDAVDVDVAIGPTGAAVSLRF